MSREGLRYLISNKFSGDPDEAGLQTSLWVSETLDLSYSK